jgi:hypothetical protein
VILVTGNRRLWAASLAVSLIIFAVLYFTVIKPDNNTANQAVKAGLQQSHQVINQAQKQLSHTSGNGGAATKQAQKSLGKAAKLTTCLQAAGTDATKLAACQTKYSS